MNKAKWPKKKEKIGWSPEGAYCDGWNDAKDACRLASIVSEEEIEKIIFDNHILTHGVMDTDVFVVVPYKTLARAIAEYVNRGER